MTKKQPKKLERPGVDRLGRAPLHYAAHEGELAQARELLRAGADGNAKDDNGWTPLHFATKSGHLEIAQLLLAAGADVNARDSNGNSPLSNAVFAYQDDGALIEALRAAGADPLRENNHGVSPVSLARDIANCDVARFFADQE
ncbi:MAG: ankyrin repeat domain-containing protein [Burkholderiales bacterium]|nr:ankyrin repeat domain-containing protein [Burkholderiales bacterium]